MSPASRYVELLKMVPWIAWLTVPALILYMVFFLHLPEMPADRVTAGNDPGWKEPSKLQGADWSLFRQLDGDIPPDAGSLAARFRLAGTFFEYGASTPNTRKAILDDIKGNEQYIVGEGGVLDGVKVVRVFNDHVLLRENEKEEKLWLMFAKSSGAPDTEAGTKAGTGTAKVGGGIDKFGGKRVGDRRWVFDRKLLTEYYNELMDEPQRLVAVFDSLDPLYGADGKITGYQLGIEGEPDFFDSVGFREGDVVRRVNSLEMTNRGRAEHFISEFAKGRANVFVIEIERGGETAKYIYQVK